MVPVRLADPETDRHWPWIRRLRSAAAVHWAALPVQLPSATGVPLADRLPTSFRHLPPTPKRTGPAGPWPVAAVTVQLKSSESVAPAGSDALTCTG